MQNYDQAANLLKLLDRPAFVVADGMIVLANEAALQKQVNIGAAIDSLFVTGKEAYDAYSDGRLYMRLNIAETVWDVSVTRLENGDIFLLERSVSESELRILSLAALQLRAPLGELMALTGKLADDEDAVAAAKLNRNLLSMQRLVANMADAPRYAHSVNYKMQTENITAYLQEMMQKCAFLLEKAGFILSYSGPKEDIFLPISSERMERAVYNLLSNAMKFSPIGSTITVRLEKANGFVMLTVTDEGNGLSNATDKNIFTRYLREPSIEDSRIGMGLGMFYVCAGASSHGGTVLVRQIEGKGLSVTMTLSTKNDRTGLVSSKMIPIDYSGGRDHALLELSDVLPYELYQM